MLCMAKPGSLAHGLSSSTNRVASINSSIKNGKKGGGSVQRR